MECKARGGYCWKKVEGPKFKEYWWIVMVLILIAFLFLVLSVPEGTSADQILLISFLVLPFEMLIHEGFHMASYRRRIDPKRIGLKFGIMPYVSVKGGLPYKILRDGCAASLYTPGLCAATAFVACILGVNEILPYALILMVASCAGCMGDLYWLWHTRKIGAHGRYFDRGRRLDVVWKKEG
jgi:hypothetical protein